MKIKTVRKWSEEKDPKFIDKLAWVIVAVMAGCYVYLGILLQELFK